LYSAAVIPRAVALFVAVAACSSVKGPEGSSVVQVDPTLESIWQNVFVVQCAFSSCHSMEGHRSGLVLATSRQAEPSQAEFLLACGNLVQQPVENPNVKDKIRVVPGDAQQSFLVQALEGQIDLVKACSADEDCNCPMPLNNTCTTTMPPGPILAIRRWIDGMSDDACVAFGAEPPPVDAAADASDGPIGDAAADAASD
jgi:hypothetical protein